MSNGQDPSTQSASPYTRNARLLAPPISLGAFSPQFSPPHAPAPAPPLAASIPDKLALPPPSRRTARGPPIGPHCVHCHPLQCLHRCAVPPQCPELAACCQAGSLHESRSMASAAVRTTPSPPIARRRLLHSCHHDA
jgi:hypothetical protein